jgi:uncharacterized membrane protein
MTPRILHRFLSSQSFYPIVLSTGLAFVTYFGRILQSDSTIIYRNLVWNLFLAWLPYLFSLLAAYLYIRNRRRWWLLAIPAGLWLIFFPNAPYIITDFLHLEERAYVPLWYDILLLSIFAWTGIFLAIASLRTMQRLVHLYAGRVVSWLFVGIALALSGLGIYLGRFERWNSWDLLFSPHHILENVMARFADPLDNERFFAFTILFTLLLLVTYLMFISGRDFDRLDK